MAHTDSPKLIWNYLRFRTFDK